VLSVGGTTLNIDSAGNYISESGWSGSGGGISLYESKPSYQSALPYSKRSNPDVSYNADPATGVPVYDTVSYAGQTGWFTSAAPAPAPRSGHR
jgi:subtilase family serine protease